MNRILPWLLNILWCSVLLAASPVLLFRMLRHGKYRHSWRERLLGELPQFSPIQSSPSGDSTTQRIWFHAVSVGEILLLESVIEELLTRQPDTEIVISATTHTGLDVARRRFPEHTVCCFPLDFTWAVRRAIQRVQPTQIVLVELELWPNFILAAAESGVWLGLINGRLGERSFRGYSKAAWLMRRLIRSFDLLAVQNETYAERFVALGAKVDRVTVTGSVKFDGLDSDRSNEKTQSLRTAVGLAPDEPVFVAGSTVDPEEDIVLDAWQAVRREHPELRLIIVPRHKERFDEVGWLIESRNLGLLRRSNSTLLPVCGETTPRACEGVELLEGSGTSASIPSAPDGEEETGLVFAEAILDDGLPPEPAPVILLDTLGELSVCWGLADFAFVGGSMANRGGQNMIEPAGYAAAICFGPDTRNFRDVVTALLKRDAAKVVYDSVELEETLLAWLTNRHAATDQGQRARDYVLGQNGATSKTVSCLIGGELQATSTRRVA